jgi:hypothetical protein
VGRPPLALGWRELHEPRLLGSCRSGGWARRQDSWGLADAPIRQIGNRRWHLDFAWDAIPPLVNLRRIVLPVARSGGPPPGHYVRKK